MGTDKRLKAAREHPGRKKRLTAGMETMSRSCRERGGIVRAVIVLSMLMAWPMASCAMDEKLLTITSWGNGAPELTILAPSGYAIEKLKGPDFDVHYVRSMDPGAPSMGIYIGHHPNTFSSQKKEVKTATEADVILDKKVAWAAWQEKEKGETIYHCETVISGVFTGNGGVENLKLHIFVQGAHESQVNGLKAAARSLRIVSK